LLCGLWATNYSKSCWENAELHVLNVKNHPDYCRVGDLLRRHLDVLAGQFVQVLLLCHKAGLVNLGRQPLSAHAKQSALKIPADAAQIASILCLKCN